MLIIDAENPILLAAISLRARERLKFGSTCQYVENDMELSIVTIRRLQYRTQYGSPLVLCFESAPTLKGGRPRADQGPESEDALKGPQVRSRAKISLIHIRQMEAMTILMVGDSPGIEVKRTTDFHRLSLS
ncbi:hypothetical protein FISHEDRAFT_59193 [Fistulina hepatica ATCC 64428]|uniref:Uncharacterized protein n=1 Tax=Fistulina hepatica ATCC 64428 TaxID=1128425 RepID=A0A0D7ACC0_9AGAR|nr:hypothetical protein FISHEDRAFT_59193 [Fistulina hepatica ATCC 64428]